MDFQNNFKDFLKAADSEQDREFRELQEAIDRSKETAKDEKLQREFDRQSVEIRNFYKKSEKSDDAVPRGKKIIRRQRSHQKLPTLHKGFLEIVHHDPVFQLPIPTNPKFRKYSISQRANLLSESFTQIDKCVTKLALESLVRAPFPSPIHPSNNYKNPETSNGTSSNFEELVDQIPVENLYVSRSGRQVKRKIYTEQEDADSEPDFAGAMKKNKPEIGDSSTKIILDTPYVPEEGLITEEKNTSTKLAKPKKETPRKSYSLSTKKPTSRSDAMYEKLLQDEEKRKQQEAEMEDFEKTLPTLENSEDFVIETSPVRENEENFQRRRVPPPVFGKKARKPRKVTKQEDPGPSSEILSERPVLKPSAVLPKNSTKSKPPGKSVTQVDKMNCPICDGEFLKSEIEDHAASCGIEDDVVENLIPQSGVKRLKCEICNKDFPANAEFEVHVRHCIATHLVM
ncbi:uncharacterized protein LOC123011335 [Tribolium madens]|uniref:uncharacterized protein LOC123011335 n=1 Tax=Tribolium madens TaxID=41895 RepID=UPI001CF73972|nr:uncharacterized protein LOC123011335 [Tribolium madens]